MAVNDPGHKDLKSMVRKTIKIILLFIIIKII